MPRADGLSTAFDYLFAPIEVEESPEDSEDTRPAAERFPQSGGTGSARMAFAAFVLATLGVGALLALLLAQRPQGRTDPMVVPVEPAPSSTATPAVPNPTAPTASTDAAPTQTPQTIETAPQQQFAPHPAPAGTPSPRESVGPATNSPVTRAPISVAPQTRAPFPNQQPRTGGGGQTGGGGLLGRLL